MKMNEFNYMSAALELFAATVTAVHADRVLSGTETQDKIREAVCLVPDLPDCYAIG